MSKKKFVLDDTLGQVQLSENVGECPYCHSDNVDLQGPDFQDGMIYYDGHCADCENDFVEWYEVEYNSTYGYPLKKKSKKGKKNA